MTRPLIFAIVDLALAFAIGALVGVSFLNHLPL